MAAGAGADLAVAVCRDQRDEVVAVETVFRQRYVGVRRGGNWRRQWKLWRLNCAAWFGYGVRDRSDAEGGGGSGGVARLAIAIIKSVSRRRFAWVGRVCYCGSGGSGGVGARRGAATALESGAVAVCRGRQDEIALMWGRRRPR
eukprot:jgi/Undpi1/13085/HiC_scaffold_8.g02747.m1